MSTHEIVVQGNEVRERRGEKIVIKDYYSVLKGYQGMYTNSASTEGQKRLAKEMINLLESAHEQSLERSPGNPNGCSFERDQVVRRLKREYEQAHDDKDKQKEIRRSLCEFGEEDDCVGQEWKEQYDA